MRNNLECTECGHQYHVPNMSSKIVDGEIRRTGDTCPECGGRADLANKKIGTPGLNFTDSGTGKKRVL